MPVLDAVASRSADGSEIYVKAVNTSPTDALDTEIELRGVAVRPEGEWHVLTAPSLGDAQQLRHAGRGAASSREVEARPALPRRVASALRIRDRAAHGERRALIARRAAG